MAKGWGMLLAAFVVLIGRLSSIEVAAQPSFNRTEGVVELGTCQGLKSKVELGLDIDIILNSDIVCTETISLSANQIVRISSAANEEYLIAVAEDFAVPDPTSSSLLLVPAGASLSLEQLRFTNEAGVQGSPGAVRAIWNLGTLDVNTCTFESLNYAAIQDGGAIYNSGDAGSVTVGNSTFNGNVGKDRGGAIAAFGQGYVDLTNCTFYGNEAFGASPDRRAGSGGAIYASPGMVVSVMNSSFESCLGRYGGAALFLCGGSVTDSTFLRNEADGLFGAVVNGDMSDETRLNASIALGTSDGQNYTCPPLSVAGSVFEKNIAGNGFGGAVASVDASLSVFNSTIVGNVGGAIYFGTSDGSGRDTLDMERIEFNQNEASDYIATVPTASAFFVERIGLTLESNATDSANSASAALSAEVQAESSQIVVGTGVDLYCFQNNPYECEGYFGQAKLTLTGTLRCSTCEGDAFTGIGTPGSAPTPAPIVSDDDDGLSKMGQERAQGGTPAPTVVGYKGTGSSSSGSGDGTSRNGASDEPELFGQTGSMRWVVIGLMGGLGAALLICLCMFVACRGGGICRRKRENEEEMRAARVGPMSLSTIRPASDGSQDPIQPMSSVSSTNQLFVVSPGTSAVKRSSVVTSSSVEGTPLATRKAREVARQRAMQRASDADSAAEAGYWNSAAGGWAESGPGLVLGASPSFSASSRRKSGRFAALPGTEAEHERQRSGSRLSIPVPVSVATGRGRGAGKSRSPDGRSRSNSRGRSRNAQDIGAEGRPSQRGNHNEAPDSSGPDPPRAVKTLAGGARLPIAIRDSRSDSVTRGSRPDGERGSRSTSRSPRWRAASLTSPPDDLLSSENSNHRPVGQGFGIVSSSSRSPSGEISTSKLRGGIPAGAVASLQRRESSSSSMNARENSGRAADGAWEWDGRNLVPSSDVALSSQQERLGLRSRASGPSGRAKDTYSRLGFGSSNMEEGELLQHDYGPPPSRSSSTRSMGQVLGATDGERPGGARPYGSAMIVSVKRGDDDSARAMRFSSRGGSRDVSRDGSQEQSIDRSGKSFRGASRSPA